MAQPRRLLVLTTLVLCVLAIAISQQVRATGSLFELGSSPRLQGMGGVGLALASGADATYYNPALLPSVDSWRVSSSYALHFGGVSYGTIGIAGPHLGLQFLLLDSGPIVGMDAETRYSTQGLVGSLGTRIIPGVASTGVRLRLLRTTAPTRKLGWAVDPCLSLEFGSLRAGVIVEGVASRGFATRRGGNEPWEQSVSVGLGYTLDLMEDARVAVAAELRDVFSTSREAAIGAEVKIDWLTARVGVDGVGLAVGASFTAREMEFDYCCVFGRAGMGASSRMRLGIDLRSVFRKQQETQD